MNSNTIAGYFGTGTRRGQIPSLVVATTTETVFSAGNDTGASLPAVLSVPLQTAVVGSSNPLDPNANSSILSQGLGRQFVPAGANRPYFNSDSFNLARPFKIRISGTFTSGVASNDLLIGLYLGSSLTLGSNTAISVAATTGTAGKFGVVSGHFSTEYYLIWDVTSGKLDGLVENAIIGASGVTGTVIAPVAVTQVSAAAASNLTFVATAKWNTANAGNTVNVSEFSIEQN